MAENIQGLSRQQLYQLQPAIAEHLIALGKAAGVGLEPALVHLVKARVSQINGCGFCLYMHTEEARKDGESQQRLDVLPAWREVPGFSGRERAALAWAEAVTLVAEQAPSEALREQVSEYFSTEELVNLTATIVTINGWNRVAVSFGFVPGH